MEITPTTVPGVGLLYTCVTRSGQRIGVLSGSGGRRSLLLYDPGDPDVSLQSIGMDRDEADQLAEILHSRSTLDRLAAVEQRLAELTGSAT